MPYTINITPVLAVPPVHGPFPQAKMFEQAVGGGKIQKARNADCTRSNKVNKSENQATPPL